MLTDHEPPDRLNEAGKVIWNILVSELEDVSPMVYDIMERYCYLVAAVRDIELRVRGRELVQGVKGNVGNPLVKTITVYNQTILTLAKQLGVLRRKSTTSVEGTVSGKPVGKKVKEAEDAAGFLKFVKTGFGS